MAIIEAPWNRGVEPAFGGTIDMDWTGSTLLVSAHGEQRPRVDPSTGQGTLGRIYVFRETSCSDRVLLGSKHPPSIMFAIDDGRLFYFLRQFGVCA